ncbi:uncharacterized protein RCC_02245 [Ramularia collo-cygni]|uniref:Uncharacterized protein n=1 Tax=Ramularia collo-cygni TaxID=112498 RepID=A0A2D3UME3_9PEZI|nr:uncharacterized protein RCC_02245 [Ramularia collo-cygni]CZT16402.1 uncharacterized protein RCC_02245 [Ramularia collo-cygni]
MFQAAAGKKKKNRRMHSRDDPNEEASGWQEYSKSSRQWVNLGTAINPMAEDEDEEMLLGHGEEERIVRPPGAPGNEDDEMLLGYEELSTIWIWAR